MNSSTKTIHLELGNAAEALLEEADEAPVEIEAGGSRYLLTRLEDDTKDEFITEQPDSILNIIGIGATDEPTNIAEHKLEYLADAFEPKRDR